MSRGGEKMADKNTTSNINLAAAEELPKAQSKFKEFIKKFMKRKTAVISPKASHLHLGDNSFRKFLKKYKLGLDKMGLFGYNTEAVSAVPELH